MKSIKVGDRVESFLDARVKGTVVEFLREGHAPWMVGSTSQKELYCVLELDTGQKIRYKVSELHYSFDD